MTEPGIEDGVNAERASQTSGENNSNKELAINEKKAEEDDEYGEDHEATLINPAKVISDAKEARKFYETYQPDFVDIKENTKNCSTCANEFE